MHNFNHHYSCSGSMCKDIIIMITEGQLTWYVINVGMGSESGSKGETIVLPQMLSCVLSNNTA